MYQVDLILLSFIKQVLIQLLVNVLNKLLNYLNWLIDSWGIMSIIIHYGIKKLGEAVVSVGFDFLVRIVCLQLFNEIGRCFVGVVLDLNVV